MLAAMIGGLSFGTSSACHSTGWRPFVTDYRHHHLNPAKRMKPMIPGSVRLTTNPKSRGLPDTNDGLLSHAATAKLLGIGRKTLYAWLKRPDCPPNCRPVHRRGRPYFTREAQTALVAYRDRFD
jgi:hypothetical protein